jgi:hypothetical protein
MRNIIQPKIPEISVPLHLISKLKKYIKDYPSEDRDMKDDIIFAVDRILKEEQK